MKKYFIINLFIAAVTDYSSYPVWSQEAWTTFELNGKSVKSMAMGSDEYHSIWIGVHAYDDEQEWNGVVKYNETGWDHYGTESGLISDFVLSIAADKDDVKWFGTFLGLSRLAGRTWTNFTKEDILKYEAVRAIAVDKKNVVWFGVSHNSNEEAYVIMSYDGDTWRIYWPGIDVHLNAAVEAIAVDRDNVKWFGTLGGGISCFDGDNSQVWTVEDGLADSTVLSVAVDLDNVKWFATSDGVSCYDGTSLKTYDWGDGLPHGPIWTVAVDSNNAKWFGTQSGVTKYDGSTWITYTSDHGLVSNDIRTIAVDAGNRIWFGSVERGASRFDESLFPEEQRPEPPEIRWKTYSSKRGLVSDDVTAMAVDADNVKWFCTRNGISRYDDLIWINYTSEDGLVAERVGAVAVDNSDAKWFGTASGLVRFDGTAWTSFTTADGLVNDIIYSIAVDRNNRKIIGTFGGVSIFDDRTFANFTTSNGLADDHISAVAVDLDNVLWFGTSSGVSRYDGQFRSTYTTADGLVSDKINAIAVDTNNVKWFGTDAGVSNFDGNRWTTYTESNGLAHNSVLTIGVDKTNNIWFGGYYTREIHSHYEHWGTVTRFDGETWTSYDHNHCESMRLHPVTSFTVDDHNVKWIGTMGGGVSKFTLDAFADTEEPAESSTTGFELLGNYPNPFNTSTKIEVVMPFNSRATLSIYNIMGQKVREFVLSNDTRARQSIIWKGEDNNGIRLATGVYLYTLIAKGYAETRKLLLLK